VGSLDRISRDSGDLDGFVKRLEFRVRRIFEWYTEGKSARWIADALNRTFMHLAVTKT
jgi:hypothetical protein